jgi:hypothetical protein
LLSSSSCDTSDAGLPQDITHLAHLGRPRRSLREAELRLGREHVVDVKLQLRLHHASARDNVVVVHASSTGLSGSCDNFLRSSTSWSVSRSKNRRYLLGLCEAEALVGCWFISTTLRCTSSSGSCGSCAALCLCLPCLLDFWYDACSGTASLSGQRYAHQTKLAHQTTLLVVCMVVTVQRALELAKGRGLLGTRGRHDLCLPKPVTFLLALGGGLALYHPSVVDVL